MSTSLMYVGLVLFSAMGSVLFGTGLSEKFAKGSNAGVLWMIMIIGLLSLILSFSLVFYVDK